MTPAGRPLRAGTRGSALALWQTERVRSFLATRGQATERIEIKTTGDVILDVPLSRIGQTAVFTKQLDEALLAGRIDFAVHSLKDLPTVLPDGIALVAVSAREDPRDALVGRGPLRWGDVPRGGTIATSSQRRRAQLLRARPDLTIVEIRGNVDTRLAKLDATAEWSATILAAAGLVRLGFSGRIGDLMPSDVMLPAPGQGALAITARSDDRDAKLILRAAMNDGATERCTAAERAFLRRLEGGCSVPVAALGRLDRDNILQLSGRVVSLDGTLAAQGERATDQDGMEAAEQLGVALAEDVLARGADRILAGVRESHPREA